jgi:hypothetical protein
MAFQGYSEDQTICSVCKGYNKQEQIAKANGIKYSHWDVDTGISGDTDFSAKHHYQGAKWMIDGNIHCCGDPTKRVKVMGNTWLDLWKSADRLCKDKVCGHRFTEWFTFDGNKLTAHFGS